MDQRTLRSFESPSDSSTDDSSSSAPAGIDSPFFGLSPESDADVFRHQVWQVYRETYKDEGPHQHPIFAQLRIDRSKYVAMQIYAGLMNGHSLACTPKLQRVLEWSVQYMSLELWRDTVGAFRDRRFT